MDRKGKQIDLVVEDSNGPMVCMARKKEMRENRKECRMCVWAWGILGNINKKEG